MQDAVYLTRHETAEGARWAADNRFLSPDLNLAHLLELPRETMFAELAASRTGDPAAGTLLPPIDAAQEVWASGVTYLRSRQAREAESETSADVYERVYDAERPELFSKAVGWRVVGHGMPIRVRRDSRWTVPEPELTLVINAHAEIVGYTVGNDVSSRDIEGENPLYLPQAKIYDGSCALGPGIVLADADTLKDLPIAVETTRRGKTVFEGDTRSSQMKRPLEELVSFLYRETTFPHGAFLMTGTGIVPSDGFTLQTGDIVRITIGTMTLENQVA